MVAETGEEGSVEVKAEAARTEGAASSLLAGLAAVAAAGTTEAGSVVVRGVETAAGLVGAAMAAMEAAGAVMVAETGEGGSGEVKAKAARTEGAASSLLAGLAAAAAEGTTGVGLVAAVGVETAVAAMGAVERAVGRAVAAVGERAE